MFAAFILLSAIPDVLRAKDAVDFIVHLGYPVYLLPFLGLAKILGSLTVVLPRFPRLKEWAYAGIVFDLIGALYSHLSVGDPASFWIFPVVGLTLAAGSYTFWRRSSAVQSS
ncbi:MAG: DoxX family protein [Acidobacteriota bacterium]